MKKSMKPKIVEIRENDGTTIVPIEISQHFIEFYKKETGHSKASLKGLSQFIQYLVNSHSYKD